MRQSYAQTVQCIRTYYVQILQDHKKSAAVFVYRSKQLYIIVSDCYASWCSTQVLTCTSLANTQFESGDKESWPHWWLAWLKLHVRAQATSLGAGSWFCFSSRHFQAVQLAKYVLPVHTYVCTYRHTIGREERGTYTCVLFYHYLSSEITEHDTVYYIEPVHNLVCIKLHHVLYLNF